MTYCIMLLIFSDCDTVSNNLFRGYQMTLSFHFVVRKTNYIRLYQFQRILEGYRHNAALVSHPTHQAPHYTLLLT